MIRESIGSMLYFTGYEFLLRKFLKPGQRSQDAPLHGSLISGGFAGLCYWSVVYPIDYVKTIMQTDNLADRQYKGVMETISKRLAEGGVKTFYKGYLVCLLRAAPVNAGGFLAFEASMRVFGRSKESQ